MSTQKPATLGLVLVPSLITLAVTGLRLAGETQRWPEPLFSRAPGGGGSPIGISWLAFVFAVYFAIKLQDRGDVPALPGRAILRTLAALGITIGGLVLLFLSSRGGGSLPALLGAFLLVAAALAVMRSAWPSYWNALVAYAVAARLPVIVIGFFAIRGDWGTHYDAVPPAESVPAGWFERWIAIGVIPQILVWIPYTVVLCGLVGLVVAAVRRQMRAASP